MPPYIYNPSKEVVAVLKRAAIRETLLELLIKEKKEEITVHCGLKALDQIMHMPEFNKSWDDKFLNIADCIIKIEKNFDADSPWDVVYNEEVIFG
jgi:hemoglobin-like flavoprotein